MKQFYLLMIVALLLSGLVLMRARIKGKITIIDDLLVLLASPRGLILLGFFDLSVGFANLVWVGSGIPVFQNLFPSLTILCTGILLIYEYMCEQFPTIFNNRKMFILDLITILSNRSFDMGVLCCVMAFIHFFAESILFL